MSRLGNELSLDSRPLSRLSTHNTSSETNVMVAWLERFEDHAQFPVDELLMEFDFSGDVGHSLREKDTVIIFIHHLRSGLYRIHIRSTIRYTYDWVLCPYTFLNLCKGANVCKHCEFHQVLSSLQCKIAGVPKPLKPAINEVLER